MSDINLTSKQKIDKMLGIESSQSIDDFLNELQIDSTEISSTINNIDDAVKDNLQKIDDNIAKIEKNSAIAPMVLTDINSSMKEVEDLIQLSKQMFKHIYESCITTDLIDSELIAAASKLLESIHINIAEFISLYRDKQRYIDKVKLMTFQQEQKKELMALKHKYDMEKTMSQVDANATDTDGHIVYSVEEVTKILNNVEKLKEI